MTPSPTTLPMTNPNTQPQPLTVEKIGEYREVTKCGVHLGVGGTALALVLDSHESLRAALLQRDEEIKRLREALKPIALRDPMKVHGPADPFVRISTDEHKAIREFATPPSQEPQR